MRETLQLLRTDLAPAVRAMLAEKYNVGEGEVGEWIRKARAILAEETREDAKAMAGEIVGATMEHHRIAKKAGDTALALKALEMLWEFSGNKVSRTKNENANTHRDLPTLPPTPAELIAIIAEQRGCTTEEAARILQAEADATPTAGGDE